jgi:hypothetical protein
MERTRMRVAIATEDELSEALAETLVIDVVQGTIGQRLRRSGFGYLRKNIASFTQIAQHVTPVLLLTDLDRNSRLGSFVRKSWDWRRAAKHSPSLARSVVRLEAFRAGAS